MDYYLLFAPEVHTECCACHLLIKWNVPLITSNSNASGFIVQKFGRKLSPPDALKNKNLLDTEYYEAWKVENGAISPEDHGECDDMFSIGEYLCFPTREFICSLDTKGRFEFTGSVYWIPESSPLYRIVNSWSKEEVPQANGLRATYQCKELDGVPPLFIRDSFIHEWDLVGEDHIYSAVKAAVFRYCPKNTKRDQELLSVVYEILAEKYEHIADRIVKEWEARWK